MNRLFEVIEAHNIRYFFYAGGNDSQDTTNKVHQEAAKRTTSVPSASPRRSTTISRTPTIPRATAA